MPNFFMIYFSSIRNSCRLVSDWTKEKTVVSVKNNGIR